ncbi:hypothetical protein LT330_008040 [Penicillium expansum]|nr:hypothetical protein N7453_011992 [Penicillium expansum]KAK4866877.1 hypothetical protein LT330_008040 [Penicillium expansum]
MPEIEYPPVLPMMIGETITTCSWKPLNSDIYPPRDWVIIEKLSERQTPMTPKDLANGMGPAYTAGKYFCHLAGAGNEKKQAFMRIYKQIPLAGTEIDNVKIRGEQASKPRKHLELNALKHLTENRCCATPRLLGYETGKQDKNDCVPGGYIMYIVWEKVQGDSLDPMEFWSLPYNQRESIRAKEVLELGVELSLTTASKIILDKTTGDVKDWDDYFFVMFFLALNSLARYNYFPITAEDIKVHSNGWMW